MTVSVPLRLPQLAVWVLVSRAITLIPHRDVRLGRLAMAVCNGHRVISPLEVVENPGSLKIHSIDTENYKAGSHSLLKR